MAELSRVVLLIKPFLKVNRVVPGIVFICQEVLDLNMAGAYMSA